MISNDLKHVILDILGAFIVRYCFIFIAYFCFGHSSLQSFEEQPDLIINIDEESKIIQGDGQISPTGIKVRSIEKSLFNADLDYKLNFLPWIRALRETQNSSNAIIYDILRTPERENNFHWLKPLREVRYNLFTRNNKNLLSKGDKEIADGGFIGVCELASAQCKWLRDFGFSEENIMAIPSLEQTQIEMLILRERADFYFGIEEEKNENLAILGEVSDSIVIFKEYNSETSYLAAPKSINPSLLKTLKKALQD